MSIYTYLVAASANFSFHDANCLCAPAGGSEPVTYDARCIKMRGELLSQLMKVADIYNKPREGMVYDQSGS